MSRPVTFRKLNIFWWDFLQNISTRSEKHESGLTRDIPAPWREVYTQKVTKQTHKFDEIQKIFKTEIIFRCLVAFLAARLLHNIHVI